MSNLSPAYAWVQALWVRPGSWRRVRSLGAIGVRLHAMYWSCIAIVLLYALAQAICARPDTFRHLICTFAVLGGRALLLAIVQECTATRRARTRLCVCRGALATHLAVQWSLSSPDARALAVLTAAAWAS